MSDKFNALKVQKIYNLSFIYLKNMVGNKKPVSHDTGGIWFLTMRKFFNFKIGFSLFSDLHHIGNPMRRD